MNCIPRVFPGLTLGLIVVASSCEPCETVTVGLSSPCHNPDAGPMEPNSSFVLEGYVALNDTDCAVTVSKGEIFLEVTGRKTCGLPGPGAGIRPRERPSKCTIPPLDAGSYTVRSQPAFTLTLPVPDDGGLPLCPF